MSVVLFFYMDLESEINFKHKQSTLSIAFNLVEPVFVNVIFKRNYILLHKHN